MAPPAAARGTRSEWITITYANGTYDCQPQDTDVDNDGKVIFESKKRPCWVYYTPSNAFLEQTGDKLELDDGPNGPFTPRRRDFTILYCATDPNSTCTPRSRIDTGGYTIKVGSGRVGGIKKHRKQVSGRPKRRLKK